MIDIHFNDDISFNNITYYQPSIINRKDFRILVDNEIKYKINIPSWKDVQKYFFLQNNIYESTQQKQIIIPYTLMKSWNRD